MWGLGPHAILLGDQAHIWPNKSRCFCAHVGSDWFGASLVQETGCRMYPHLAEERLLRGARQRRAAAGPRSRLALLARRRGQLAGAARRGLGRG